MLDHCLSPHDGIHCESHPSTFFGDPTKTERVIFLPGGKAMIVDWDIEGFVKGVVSFTIAGAVIVGAGIYGLMWADERIKKKQQKPSGGVAPRRPVPKEDSEESGHSSGDESSVG